MLKDRGREGMGLLPAGRDVPHVPSVMAGALGVPPCAGGEGLALLPGCSEAPVPCAEALAAPCGWCTEVVFLSSCICW